MEAVQTLDRPHAQLRKPPTHTIIALHEVNSLPQTGIPKREGCILWGGGVLLFCMPWRLYSVGWEGRKEVLLGSKAADDRRVLVKQRHPIIGARKIFDKPLLPCLSTDSLTGNEAQVGTRNARGGPTVQIGVLLPLLRGEKFRVVGTPPSLNLG